MSMLIIFFMFHYFKRKPTHLLYFSLKTRDINEKPLKFNLILFDSRQ